jgi:prepilin-type N-terminal cleavage/methylation domain-containing protein/prepilin-type processing-associated H-X9-DG protein
MSTTCKKPPTAFRGAFTLIEVLVVVAIIALLVSILIPSLARAREMARRSVCASNLHQQVLGMQSYAADNRNYLPWRGWFSYDISESRHEAYGYGGSQKVLVNLALLIGKHLNKTWDVLYCPCTITNYRDDPGGLSSLMNPAYPFTHGGYNYALPMGKRSGAPRLDENVYPLDAAKLDGNWLNILKSKAPPDAIDASSGQVNLAKMMSKRSHAVVMDFVVGGGKTLHPNGLNVLFNDGHGKFVRYQDLVGGGAGTSGSVSAFELWYYAGTRP